MNPIKAFPINRNEINLIKNNNNSQQLNRFRNITPIDSNKII